MFSGRLLDKSHALKQIHAAIAHRGDVACAQHLQRKDPQDMSIMPPLGFVILACKEQRYSKCSAGVCPLQLGGSAIKFWPHEDSSGDIIWINSWHCIDVRTVPHTQSLLRLREYLSGAGVWLSEHVKCCLTQRSTTSMAQLKPPFGSAAGTAMGVTLRGWLLAPSGPPWPTPSCMFG